MEIGELSQLSASSQNLDHHGLVAATYKDLKILEKIHARIPNKDPRRIVSTGHAVLAMILNGLGFTNRRLYLSPQFFQDKPVERLVDEQIQAKHLDDHALGEALDEIAEYGATRLFGELAFEIGIEENLFSKSAHLDSTSIAVQGDYSNGSETGSDAIEVTYGFSKDHRADLKQVMMSLCTSGPSDFPFWMEPQSGNASDKKEFDLIIKRVQAFKKQLRQGPDFRWVADSALYSKDGLLSHNDYLWITRVPETLNEVKQLVEKNDSEIEWKSDDELQKSGYKISTSNSNYGGIKQRWILIYSQQAYDREKKTFDRNLLKKSEALEKALWHLGNQVFGCEADIEKELKRVKKDFRTTSYLSDLQLFDS
jgi:transposase